MEDLIFFGVKKIIGAHMANHAPITLFLRNLLSHDLWKLSWKM